jgi:hypothetical protein
VTLPDDTVPALAAQVADLRGKVLTVSALMDRLGLNGALSLAGQVADLTHRVDEHCGDDGPPPRMYAPNWTGLAPGERAEALADLEAWVTDFLEAEHLTGPLRPCWPAHRPAVWQLSTLRAEWQRVYGRKNPEVAGALTWNDRWLPGVVARLENILADCKGGCALAKSQARPSRPRAR